MSWAPVKESASPCPCANRQRQGLRR